MMIDIAEPDAPRAMGDAVPCHLFMPDIEWPRRPAAFVNQAVTFQTADTVGDHPAWAPPPMDTEPQPDAEPQRGIREPVLFWALVATAFASVLATAQGWL